MRAILLPAVIARTWYGDVPVEKSAAYRKLLRDVGLADYSRVLGNKGGYVLERTDGGITRFMLVSFWDSLESIKGYAGDNIEAPAYTSFDPQYLLSLEPTVQHHTVYARCLDMRDGVLARLWHGAVPLSKSQIYLDLMQNVGLYGYERTPGNLSAYLLFRTTGDAAHFTTLTFWESRSAIEAFAGADIERARYYDFDPHYLIEMEPTVVHYDVYASL